MVKPPWDSPGRICLSSLVSAKLSWVDSMRMAMGRGLKLQTWKVLRTADRRKIVPTSMTTGPTAMLRSSWEVS